MDCSLGHIARSTVEVHFKVEIWGFSEHLRLRSGGSSHLCNDGNIITMGKRSSFAMRPTGSEIQARESVYTLKGANILGVN